MSSLSSISTDDEIWAAYDDNASYDQDNSPSKAANFIVACRILLRRRPKTVGHDGRMVVFEDGAIRSQLADAQRWAAMNAAGNGGGAKYRDFSGLRD